MGRRHNRSTAAIVVGAALLVVTVSWVGLSGGGTSPDTANGSMQSSAPSAGETSVPTDIRRNENGQTYGSAAGAMSDAETPDLVAVYATNGRIGYIRKADYLPPERTIEEVTELPRSLIRESDGKTTPVLSAPSRTVEVYASDGVSVIGEYRKE